MNQPPFVNTFGSGLNTDVDIRNQSPGTYRELINASITGNGAFYAVENIRGSLSIDSLLPADSYLNYNILGAFECFPQEVGRTGPLRKHIVIFLAFEDNTHAWRNRIFFLNTENNQLSEMKFGDTSGETERDKLNFPPDGTVDAVIFGERGYSNIYFEDNRNPLRKLACVLDFGLNPNYQINPATRRCKYTAPRTNPMQEAQKWDINPQSDTYHQPEPGGAYYDIGDNVGECPVVYVHALYERYGNKPDSCALSGTPTNFYSSTSALILGIRLYNDAALTSELTSGFYKRQGYNGVIGYTPVMGVDSFLDC